MFLLVCTILLKAINILNRGEHYVTIIYTIMPLAYYGLKHTDLHCASNNCHNNNRRTSEVPV